jgi:hypothetical protein
VKLADLIASAVAVPAAELCRQLAGPKRSVSIARWCGARFPERSGARRIVLRKTIGWLDRRWPGGDNCYRRALAEIALDRGAAREKLWVGLVKGGGHKSGHAWLESNPPERSYDAQFAM